MSRRQEPTVLIQIAIEPRPTALHASSIGRQHRDQEAEQALLAALAKIAERMPPLAYSIDEESGQIIVGALHELMLDVAIDRLKTEHGLSIAIGAPQIAYRETITSPVRVDYTHKRAAGPRGDFARVVLRVEPAFDCDDPLNYSATGGQLPAEYRPGVERAVAMILKAGPLNGFPMIDLRATLEDFAVHDIDSSINAFTFATTAAMREAVVKAGLVLMEPVMSVTVMTVEDRQETVLADIRSRRGRLIGNIAANGKRRIDALVPLANLLGWWGTLRSIARGASYSINGFDSYQPVPDHAGPDDHPAAAAAAIAQGATLAS